MKKLSTFLLVLLFILIAPLSGCGDKFEILGKHITKTADNKYRVVEFLEDGTFTVELYLISGAKDYDSTGGTWKETEKNTIVLTYNNDGGEQTYTVKSGKLCFNNWTFDKITTTIAEYIQNDQAK